MAELSELKAYVQMSVGETWDDMIDNWEFIVRKSLSIFNRWNPRIDEFRIYFSTQSYQFSKPYPRWCTISSADNLPDPLIWSADKLYEYNKKTGTLNINSVGVFMIRAGYNWDLEEVDLDENEDFVDLVTAHYLIASGNRRSAVKHSGIPFETDGDQRRTEGKELLEKTIQELQDNAPYWAFMM